MAWLLKRSTSQPSRFKPGLLVVEGGGQDTRGLWHGLEPQSLLVSSAIPRRFWPDVEEITLVVVKHHILATVGVARGEWKYVDDVPCSFGAVPNVATVLLGGLSETKFAGSIWSQEVGCGIRWRCQSPSHAALGAVTSSALDIRSSLTPRLTLPLRTLLRTLAHWLGARRCPHEGRSSARGTQRGRRGGG